MVSLKQLRHSKDNINFVPIRILMAVLISGLCLFQLFMTYRGLDQPAAMDQAQIARNIAQGRGFTTKFLRPMDVMMAQAASDRDKREVDYSQFTDTNHAPLNVYAMAVALKLTGYDRFEQHKMDAQRSNIYEGDRIISAVSSLFFLLSLCSIYVLITRIFDEVVACTSVALMGLSQLFLQYAISGLPQPLMLFLFVGILHCLVSAINAKEAYQSKTLALALCGTFVLMALLCLTSWMALWCALGLLIFCGFYFRPYGIYAAIGSGILALLLIFPLIFLTEPTGGMFPKLFTNIQACFGSGDGDLAMRATNPSNIPFNTSSFFLRLLGYAFAQFSTMYVNMGSILVTPLFFLALINRYKRPVAEGMKWATFCIWISACFGLALFGQSDSLNPSQLCPLFTPIFTAFGIALMFNFLAKLDIGASYAHIRGMAIFLVILISSGLFLFQLPSDLYMGLWVSDKGIPKFPPYYPPTLNNDLTKHTDPDQVIATDQPWAVAWYANRKALWLPRTLTEFQDELEPTLQRAGENIQGILITPSSHSMGEGGIPGIIKKYGDFTPLVLEGKLLQLAPRHNMAFAELFIESSAQSTTSRTLGSLASSRGRFSNRNFLLGAEYVYYNLPEAAQNNIESSSK